MWGESWEIKEKIGEKKISGGQRFWGGIFGGNDKKKGENFFGVCWGAVNPNKF